MLPVEIFEFLFKAVGIIALLRISHNTGRIAERIDLHDKTIEDHEKRIRLVENK